MTFQFQLCTKLVVKTMQPFQVAFPMHLKLAQEICIQSTMELTLLWLLMQGTELTPVGNILSKMAEQRRNGKRFTALTKCL